MVLDAPAALGPLLDGLSVTSGARTTVFPFVAWGRHLGHAGEMVTLRSITANPRIADVGPRPDYKTSEVCEVHLWYEDDGSFDPDDFRAQAIAAVQSVVAANEATLGSAYFAGVDGGAVQDLTSQLPSNRDAAEIVVAHHLVIPVRFRYLEAP